jgi:NADH-ubiquinone oxidoreductase chain 2
MLVIAILVLLLASTSSFESNYNHLTDYVKFNRIVLLVFILTAYLCYNALDVEALSGGIGIYGGVFKVTVLSQVFDIFLLLTGGLVTILTCFVPYNFKKYDDSQSIKYIMNDNFNMNYFFFKSKLKNYYYKKLLKNYSYNDYKDKSNIIIGLINVIKKFTELLPNIKVKTPFLVENKLYYNKLEVKEYSLLLLYTVLGGSLLISSQNLISLYLSLELQSFTLYILSASQIRSFKGTSGGLKYFLLGGLSSGFILLGCSLLYAYTGTLNLEYIYMIYSDSISNYLIDPCMLVLFAGLLFKVSAAPFHN